MKFTYCPVTGKRRWKTRAEADVVISLIWRRPHRGGRTLETRSYRCPLCNGFHLTHEPKREAS